MKSNKHFLIFAFVFIVLFIQVSAHPGRTDSKGGHWDRSSGTYHFHTGEYAGKNSSGSSSGSKNEQFAPPYETSDEELYQAEAEENSAFRKALPWFVLVALGFLLSYVMSK